MEHKNQTFKNEDVQTDGEVFIGCTFDTCKLVFWGGEPPVFKDCKYPYTVVKLEDAALATDAFFRALCRDNGVNLFGYFVDDVKAAACKSDGGKKM